MSADPRVIDLVLRWEELHDRGQHVAAEELCRDCPELLADVRRGLDDLRALQALVGTDTEAPTDPPAAGADAPAWELAAGRYRPSRFHAQGGLGEVHVAEDTELGRPVALKRIQPRVDHPDSRRRFLREAEITARLQHPGIVPVYGLTRDEAGRPCYAMRFVEGESLRDAVDHFHRAGGADRNLALRQLLGRFVAVCKTVAYAHSKGVVHLDLKPGNILLGDFDETLVVDWGLARQTGTGGAAGAGAGPAGDDETSRVAGYVAGTPAYMSPEQAAGRWDTVGPASDIYSLGATLYAVLTGRPPTAEPHRRILRPRQVNPAVPRALEAVCLKALAAEPGDRYPTALALADDVERWLGDEAVAAYREPAPARLARWARRHRPLVAGLAVLLLSLLVLGGGTWYRARLLRAEAESHTAAAVEPKLRQADGLRSQARAVPVDERARWREALGVWNESLREAEQAAELVAAGPADEDTRARVDAFLAELRPQVVEARKDRWMAERVETIRLEQTTLDRQGALRTNRLPALYIEAFKEYGVDFGADPARVGAALARRAIRAELVAALEHLILLAADSPGRHRLVQMLEAAEPGPESFARRVRRAGLARQKEALAELARTADVANVPPAALIILAEWLTHAGLWEEKIQLMRSAQVLYPGDFWINHHLANALARRPNPDWDGAARYYAAALAARPDSAVAHNNLATALASRGELDAAARHLRHALAANPNFARPYANLGVILDRQGKPAEGVNYLRTALKLQPELTEAQYSLAAILIERGELDEARSLLDQALKSDPQSPAVHANLAYLLYKQNDLDGAVRHGRRAVALNPNLARAHEILARSLGRQGKRVEALEHARAAVTFDPNDALAQSHLCLRLNERGDVTEAIPHGRRAVALAPDMAEARVNLGGALLRQGQLAEALEYLQKAAELDPTLARAHLGVGYVLKMQGKWDEALTHCQTALTKDDNDATSHQVLGEIYRHQRRWADALRHGRRAVELQNQAAAPRVELAQTLYEMGNWGGAVGILEEAVRLEPRHAQANALLGFLLWNRRKLDRAADRLQAALATDRTNTIALLSLANVRMRQGKLDEAVGLFLGLLRLGPNRASVHGMLGEAYRLQGKYAEAVASCRTALRLDPKLALAHLHLGLSLKELGQYDDSLAALRRAHELKPRAGAWPYPTADWIRETERLVALDRRLALLQAGETEPADAAERLALARFCLDRRHLPLAAARFYQAALEAEPTAGNRAAAARAAALAGVGRHDAAGLDATGRTRWRDRALTWLRAELGALQKQLDERPDDVAEALKGWQQHADFTPLRDAAGLDELSEAERTRWQALWTDVETLRRRAAAAIEAGKN